MAQAVNGEEYHKDKAKRVAAQNRSKSYWGKVARTAQIEIERVSSLSSQEFYDEFSTYYGLDIDSNSYAAVERLRVARVSVTTKLQEIQLSAVQMIGGGGDGSPNAGNIGGAVLSDLGHKSKGSIVGALSDALTLGKYVAASPSNDVGDIVDYSCSSICNVQNVRIDGHDF